MQDRMYGVVLWADSRDNKAVIWCEDHGHLAYYRESTSDSKPSLALDAGDLIAFDVYEGEDYRRASNPERVDTGFAPSLVQGLRRATGGLRGNREDRSNVVAFPSGMALSA
jgi:hypothetical protein